MAAPVAFATVDDSGLTPDPEGPPPPRPGRRLRKALIGLGLALLVLFVAALLWFVVGRDQARQLGDTEALKDFRASAVAPATGEGTASDPAGRPAAGVYAATASGNESIGLPGFDESLGPNSPVTVTFADGGCYDYRVDFNSHHWRSWTYCPTDTATFAIAEMKSWTARKAPGLNIATLSTYTCERPLDFLWPEAAVGDIRTGTCTGTSDMDDSVTIDAASIEVLALTSRSVNGTRVNVVHVRTTESLSGDQTGSEIDEWWLDADTGLPVKVEIDAKVNGASEYSVTADLELSNLTPAT